MKQIGREKRHERITKHLQGTENKPRLVVFRSKKHVYAQLVRDDIQKVIAGSSTLSKDFKSKNIKSGNKEAAKIIGKLIAKKSIKLGIKEVCFDRAGYKYHGRIQALAEGAREGGLKF